MFLFCLIIFTQSSLSVFFKYNKYTWDTEYFLKKYRSVFISNASDELKFLDSQFSILASLWSHRDFNAIFFLLMFLCLLTCCKKSTYGIQFSLILNEIPNIFDKKLCVNCSQYELFFCLKKNPSNNWVKATALMKFL